MTISRLEAEWSHCDTEADHWRYEENARYDRFDGYIEFDDPNDGWYADCDDCDDCPDFPDPDNDDDMSLADWLDSDDDDDDVPF